MPDVTFHGPDGRLEGRYHDTGSPGSPAALVLHPHPLHGGTMNNKIVYTLYRAFADRGFSVLRFNFRGVGRSEGAFDTGLASCRMQRRRWTGFKPSTKTPVRPGSAGFPSAPGSQCSC